MRQMGCSLEQNPSPEASSFGDHTFVLLCACHVTPVLFHTLPSVPTMENLYLYTLCHPIIRPPFGTTKLFSVYSACVVSQEGTTVKIDHKYKPKMVADVT